MIKTRNGRDRGITVTSKTNASGVETRYWGPMQGEIFRYRVEFCNAIQNTSGVEYFHTLQEINLYIETCLGEGFSVMIETA